MTPTERTQMLERFETADRWLTRVYDPKRSDQHRAGIWNFLMTAADPKLKHLIQLNRQLDEQVVHYWDIYKN